ncbi:MAG TPA: DMT family transporter [bacterium]|nr:DMT family transporter [bacterium]
MSPRFVRIAAALSLAAVAVVWGATFPLGKLVLRHLGPFQYLALRFGLAAALMAPLAWRDRGRLAPDGLRAGVLAGAVLFAGYALQTVGLRFTTASNAGLITGLNVVMIPLILLARRRRAPGRTLLAAVVLAAAGLWLLLWQGGRFGAGDALVLGCAAALALQAIIVGQAAPSVPAAAFACAQIATVAVLAGVWALAAESAPAAVPGAVAAAIAFMAVAATFGAYVAQAWAQRVVSPTRTGVLFAIEPVAAVGFGVAWLGEPLGPRQAAGAAAILLSVVIGETGRDREWAGDGGGREAARAGLAVDKGGRFHGIA